MPEKMLLHCCCAPCSCYPLEELKKKDFNITLYWYNPNIHGLYEYRKRLMSMGYLLNRSKENFVEMEYNPIYWFEQVLGLDKKERCHLCYRIRLLRAVAFAKEKGFDIFTSTLLYSKYQDHEAIINISEELSEEYGIDFFYTDFRVGWKKGIEQSKSLGLYRQNYCGCLFSEVEK